MLAVVTAWREPGTGFDVVLDIAVPWQRPNGGDED
jgi:hypothetical protein